LIVTSLTELPEMNTIVSVTMGIADVGRLLNHLFTLIAMFLGKILPLQFQPTLSQIL
jgi:hypothetical protein